MELLSKYILTGATILSSAPAWIPDGQRRILQQRHQMIHRHKKPTVSSIPVQSPDDNSGSRAWCCKPMSSRPCDAPWLPPTRPSGRGCRSFSTTCQDIPSSRGQCWCWWSQLRCSGNWIVLLDLSVTGG